MDTITSQGFLGSEATSPPAYCYKCGKPFPWTDSAVKAAHDLADELEGLSEEERQTLKRTLPDLLRDSPQTAVAETRFKRLMRKVGKDGYEAMKSVLVSVVTEAVRKQTFGA